MKAFLCFFHPEILRSTEALLIFSIELISDRFFSLQFVTLPICTERLMLGGKRKVSQGKDEIAFQ